MTKLHQQIYEKYLLHPAYHMTSIVNLSSILQHGILSYNATKQDKINFQSIANEGVQKKRASIIIPCTSKPLHDYVPLYFGIKTPMVAVNQHLNDDLLFLRVSLNILAKSDVVISDGNARSSETKFYKYSDIDSLQCLDVKAIHTVKYANDLGLKRKKQAELLVPDLLQWHEIYDIFVNSSNTQQRVLAVLGQNVKKVTIAPAWYFDKAKI